MRKTFLLAAASAAVLFAGAASAQTIAASPVQVNTAPELAVGLVIGNALDRDVSVETQAIGNALSYTATDPSTTTRNIRASVNQTNHGDQVAVSVVGLSDIGRELNVSTQSIGNNVSTNGKWFTDNGGLQNNTGDQIAVSAVGLIEVGRDLNVETVAIGNNTSLTGSAGTFAMSQTSSGSQAAGTLLVGADIDMSADVLSQAVGNNLRATYDGKSAINTSQTNHGAQVAGSLVGLVSVGDNLDVSTGAFGNSLSFTGGITENKSWERASQLNTGPQVAVSLVGLTSVGGDLSISTSAVGNSANFTGPTTSALPVSQTNYGPQVSVSALVGSSVTGNVTVATTSVGNSASFTSAPRP